MFRRRPIPIWDDTKGYKKPTKVLVLLTSQVGFHLGVAGRRHIHRGLNITALSFRDNENRNPLPIVSSLPFDLPSAGGPGCWWLPCPKKKKPSPGDSGVHYDQPNNVIHTYYGDNDLPRHMEHLMYNQRKHPENDRAFRVGKSNTDTNRQKAIKHLPIKESHARDEKPPNPVRHDGTKVTVRHVPLQESGKHLFVWQFYLF